MAWRARIASLAHDGSGAHDGTGKDSAARARAVLALYEQIGDPAGRAGAEWFLGFALYSASGDLAASEDHIDRALATFRSLGNRWGMAAAFNVRAESALLRGDLAALAAETATDAFVPAPDQSDRR
jgi:hypothetical protein